MNVFFALIGSVLYLAGGICCLVIMTRMLFCDKARQRTLKVNEMMRYKKE